jgi:hypothetical protein
LIEPINIKSTEITPAVSFDAGSNTFEIEGRSLPENALQFFQPLENWLKEYAQSPNTTTILSVQLDYFNSSSAKQILNLFHCLENMHKKGNDVALHWKFLDNDEDIEEMGIEFSETLQIPVKLVRLSL